MKDTLKRIQNVARMTRMMPHEEMFKGIQVSLIRAGKQVTIRGQEEDSDTYGIFVPTFKHGQALAGRDSVVKNYQVLKIPLLEEEKEQPSFFKLYK